MILSSALLSPLATLVASGAYALAALWPQRRPPSDDPSSRVPPAPTAEGPDAAWWLVALGWLAQAVTICADAVDWSSTPLRARFGFAPALSVTLWFVLAVYALERLRLQSHVVRRVLAALAAGSVVLAWLFPGQLHPRMGHGLTPLHWVMGLASYGLFGAALLHATFMRLAERRLRHRSAPGHMQGTGIPLLRLESLTLRFVSAGFVMLTLTLMAGAWFAHPWRWDHKTVLSVMAWAVFAVLLAGRHWLGWRGRTAIGWLYAGSALLLLAYVGSRFVLEVLLHRAPPVV
ncbi:MAG TPA: cytochrome c biogenesis protein CcsA [Aquabacterium sp.]|nr:cytochrome c biogenesis protein CcsA [Aquabacterium sp.]